MSWLILDHKNKLPKLSEASEVFVSLHAQNFVEVIEEWLHHGEGLDGLRGELLRQDLFVGKYPGDRNLFKPQQFDLWMIFGVALRRRLEFFVSVDRAKILLELFVADNLFEWTGIVIDCFTERG